MLINILFLDFGGIKEVILVDSQIRRKIEQHNMIDKKGFKPENLHGISYDIQIDKIIVPSDNEEKYTNMNRYVIKSGGTVYVKGDISLNMPNDCVGKIVERNSVMRMGLEVSGPCYQPGHKSNVFIRVHNISASDITLNRGQGIAQIMFESLDKEPDTPYSNDQNSSYNDEKNYTGVQGEWRGDWLEQIQKYNNKIEEIDNIESRIYGNIITIMGVFITMFSLLTFNFGAISEGSYGFDQILKIDLSLTLVLYILLGNISLIVNKRRKKSFYIMYFVLLIILVTINIKVWTFL